MSQAFECGICCELYNATTNVPTSFPCGHSCCMKHLKTVSICHVCQEELPNNLRPNLGLRDGAIQLQQMMAQLRAGVAVPKPTPAPAAAQSMKPMQPGLKVNKNKNIGKKLCKFLSTPEGCRHGSYCKFAHSLPPAETEAAAPSCVDRTAAPALALASTLQASPPKVLAAEKPVPPLAPAPPLIRPAPTMLLTRAGPAPRPLHTHAHALAPVLPSAPVPVTRPAIAAALPADAPVPAASADGKPMVKKPCHFFSTKAGCRRGSMCKFSHGPWSAGAAGRKAAEETKAAADEAAVPADIACMRISPTSSAKDCWQNIVDAAAERDFESYDESDGDDEGLGRFFPALRRHQPSIYLSNRNYFLSFADLPYLHGNDPRFFITTANDIYERRQNWIFYAEIVDNSTACIRVMDANNVKCFVAFFPKEGSFDFTKLKLHHTLVIECAEKKCFMDSTEGVSVENLNSVQVLPMTMAQVLEMDRMFMAKEIQRPCWACANRCKYKCQGCHLALYCSASCQQSDWANGHQKYCKGECPRISIRC